MTHDSIESPESVVPGLDPKYIDPVPVTQKVIEGGDFGLSTQGGNDVHILGYSGLGYRKGLTKTHV